MGFRFKALGIHLLCSAVALSLILGSLYLGWYRWPGWRLADVIHVVMVMAGVDVVLGPLLTFIIARSSKPRRELARDIALIVTIQLGALIYGTCMLWSGRPLYYAFSETVLQMVQAYDIDAEQRTIALQQNPALAPHWYSLPRWVWAPLPQDPEERQKIMASAITGGDDVISMPRYFKPWEQGVSSLRAELKLVDNVAYFSPGQKKALKESMRTAGFPTDQPNAMPLTGRGHPLLAVLDPKTLQILRLLKAD
jgi:hypothetical protein